MTIKTPMLFTQIYGRALRPVVPHTDDPHDEWCLFLARSEDWYRAKQILYGDQFDTEYLSSNQPDTAPDLH